MAQLFHHQKGLQSKPLSGYCRIVFASDLHGNQQQYRDVLSYACENLADLLIFGGDLLPKSKKRRTAYLQYRFFKTKLLPIIKESISRKNLTCPNMEIVFLYGNDDFKSIYADISKDLQPLGVKMICSHLIKCAGFNLIGYSYVPLTPFQYKDWEKFDYKGNFVRHTDYTVDGFTSTKKGLHPTDKSTIWRRSSISRDLETLFGQSTGPVILVAHAPPYNTKLDYSYGREHVGSEAIRSTILKYQPVLSLHGHIHESAELTKTTADRLNETYCFTTGNFFNRSGIRFLQVDVDQGKCVEYRSIFIGDRSALAMYDPNHALPQRKTDHTSPNNDKTQMMTHLQIVNVR